MEMPLETPSGNSCLFFGGTKVPEAISWAILGLMTKVIPRRIPKETPYGTSTIKAW